MTPPQKHNQKFATNITTIYIHQHPAKLQHHISNMYTQSYDSIVLTYCRKHYYRFQAPSPAYQKTPPNTKPNTHTTSTTYGYMYEL